MNDRGERRRRLLQEPCEAWIHTTQTHTLTNADPFPSPLVKFGQRSWSQAGPEPVMRRKSGLPEPPCPASGEDTDPLSGDAGGRGCMCHRAMGNPQQLSERVCCHAVESQIEVGPASEPSRLSQLMVLKLGLSLFVLRCFKTARLRPVSFSAGKQAKTAAAAAALGALSTRWPQSCKKNQKKTMCSLL